MNKPKTYKSGGLSRKEDYGSKKKPYPSVKSKDFAGGNRSYPIPTKADARDALRLAGLHGRSDVRAKVFRKYPELKKKAKGGYVDEYGLGGFFKNLGNAVKDVGLATADNLLSPFGGGNIIQEDDYSNKKFARGVEKINKIYGKVGETALGIATGGASTKLTGSVAGMVGDPMADREAKEREQALLKHNQLLSEYYSNARQTGTYAPTFSKGGKYSFTEQYLVGNIYDVAEDKIKELIGKGYKIKYV